MPVIVRCDHCGAEIRRSPSAVRKRNFCNQACYHTALSSENHPSWRGGPAQLTCVWCGKEYTTPKAWVRKGSRFCSTQCTIAYLGKKHTGSGSPCWKGGPVTMTCENCGKDFKVSRGIINSRTPRYCSRKCMGEWRKKHWQGRGHPQWRGGPDELYADDWNDALRDAIRARDGYQCVLCGATAEQNGRQLSVHHIDHDKLNSAWANLVTLCDSHHTATNGDQEWWVYYLPRYSRGRHLIR